MEFDKLVRDRIPELIAANGERAETRRLEDAAYHQKLEEKLVEELREYQESGSVDELADMVEVILALAAHLGHDHDAFELVRLKKLKARAGFTERVLLVRSTAD